MKRQGLIVTLGQLTKLKKDLLEQEKEFQKDLGIKNTPVDYGKEFQINIINKTPKCSDTWEIENFQEKKKEVLR